MIVLLIFTMLVFMTGGQISGTSKMFSQDVNTFNGSLAQCNDSNCQLSLDDVKKRLKGQFLLIENSFGLASRMRVLAGFKYVAKHRFGIKTVVMVWDQTRDCVGNFRDIFEPLTDTFFISKEQRPLFEAFALKSFRNHWIPFRNNLIWHGLATENYTEIEMEAYREFKPLPHINSEALRFVRSHNICDTKAFHIRRTDMIGDLSKGKLITSDEEFEKSIDSGPNSGKVFITTDNPQTRRKFSERYGDRVLTYGELPETLDGNSIRHTNLSFALTEAFIAAHAKGFFGTRMSSWSDTIQILWKICQADRCCERL